MTSVCQWNIHDRFPPFAAAREPVVICPLGTELTRRRAVDPLLRNKSTFKACKFGRKRLHGAWLSSLS